MFILAAVLTYSMIDSWHIWYELIWHWIMTLNWEIGII